MKKEEIIQPIVIEKGSAFSIYKKLFDIQQKDLFLIKDGANPHFKNRYSTLNNDFTLLKPELNKVNLLLTFITSTDNGKDSLTLRIVDVENFSSVESSISIDSSKGPQQSGSQITYFKRYLLEGLFALPVTDQTDDDGEGADKEWLNLNTPEYMRVKSAIAEGKIKTVKQIREKYAVSKTVEADLLKLGITKD
mgnify:FL=1